MSAYYIEEAVRRILRTLRLPDTTAVYVKNQIREAHRQGYLLGRRCRQKQKTQVTWEDVRQELKERKLV